jgi:hypothetical protein
VSPRRRLLHVLTGTALVFGTVIWASYRSDHFIAGMALGLSAIALWFAIMLGALLDNKIERIERDVRRIADAIAPEPKPTQAPERPDNLLPVDVQKKDVPPTSSTLPAGEHNDGLAGEEIAAPDHASPPRD